MWQTQKCKQIVMMIQHSAKLSLCWCILHWHHSSILRICESEQQIMIWMKIMIRISWSNAAYWLKLQQQHNFTMLYSSIIHFINTIFTRHRMSSLQCNRMKHSTDKRMNLQVWLQIFELLWANTGIQTFLNAVLMMSNVAWCSTISSSILSSCSSITLTSELSSITETSLVKAAIVRWMHVWFLNQYQICIDLASIQDWT